MQSTAPFVEFDEASHRYFVDGERVPSVTQVLTEAGFVDDTWYTERSRLRGTLVHQLCAVHVAGERNGVNHVNRTWSVLDKHMERMREQHGDEVANEIIGEYFHQYIHWRKSLAATHFPAEQVQGIEERVFNADIGCAGTLDVRGLMDDGTPYVMDWKTSASGEPPSWVDLQTVGYSILHDPQGLARRFSLTLSPKGAKLDEYSMEEFVCDRDTFLAALRVTRERRARQ